LTAVFSLWKEEEVILTSYIELFWQAPRRASALSTEH
jgi:hypothetical protein